MIRVSGMDDIDKVIEHIKQDYETKDQMVQALNTGGKGESKAKPEPDAGLSIGSITVTRHEIDKKILDLPLSRTTLTFVLAGVNISIANAFRRILMDEIPTPRLSIRPGTFKSTDPFMTEHFVRSRIQLI